MTMQALCFEAPESVPEQDPAESIRDNIAALSMDLAAARVELARMFYDRAPKEARRAASETLRAAWDALDRELDVLAGVEVFGDDEPHARELVAARQEARLRGPYSACGYGSVFDNLSLFSLARVKH